MARNCNTKCEVCGKEIYRNPNRKAKHVFCSKECMSIMNKRINCTLVKCNNCGKEFYRKNSQLGKNNYCSKDCFEKVRTKADLEKIINLHKQGMYDKDIAKELNMSRAGITYILNKNGFKNRHTKINNTELRLRLSQANKGKRTGIDNHKFKGYAKYTAMARGLFNSISKMYMLKKEYTCEKCGKKGGNLNSHHIKRFSVILEEFLKAHKDIINTENFSDLILKYDDFVNEDNLILLCEECHKKEHKRMEIRK